MPRRLVIYCLIILTAVLALAQSKSEVGREAGNTLELEVKTDRQNYRISEELTMHIQLLNVSKEDIYLWDEDLCWNPARGLSMYIVGKDGSPVSGALLLDCLPPPPAEGRIYDFVKLEPEAFYGRVDHFEISDLIHKPGEYDIEVTFNSFLSSDWIKKHFSQEPISKLPLWTMEKPGIAAPRVHVVITP